MPFLGREKGRSPRSRRSDDEYVVFLQGIPGHCRWQELKDLVRQTAQHIRQAVVYDDNHGFPTGVGQIIVKNEDEAWRTYHRLSTNGWEGQTLVVTLARTSAPTKPIAGPTRSPPAFMQTFGSSTPPRDYRNIALPPSPISSESTHSGSPNYQYPEYRPMMGPMQITPQPFMPVMTEPMAQPMQCYPPSPLMHCSMYDAQGWNMMPMYPISSIPPIQPLDARDKYPRWNVFRSDSWDGAMAQESDTSNESGSELSSINGDHAQGIPCQKAADPGRPLVVDGSGQHKDSLKMLSTSAPT